MNQTWEPRNSVLIQLGMAPSQPCPSHCVLFCFLAFLSPLTCLLLTDFEKVDLKSLALTTKQAPLTEEKFCRVCSQVKSRQVDRVGVCRPNRDEGWRKNFYVQEGAKGQRGQHSKNLNPMHTHLSGTHLRTNYCKILSVTFTWRLQMSFHFSM